MNAITFATALIKLVNLILGQINYRRAYNDGQKALLEAQMRELQQQISTMRAAMDKAWQHSDEERTAIAREKGELR